MEYHFSSGLKDLQPSAIREILKYASVPGVAALSAGNPAPEAFPAKEIAEISAKILRERPTEVLQYGATEGYQPLRDYLQGYLRQKYGIGAEGDQIIITSGAQQVMELAAKSLCDPGDVIISESPSFIGSLNGFRSLGIRPVGVPMCADGIDTGALEQALRAHPNARFLYTIPNFQNPCGVTMSLKKRREVYALACAYHILIVEDNPYGDLRFSGEDLPSLKSMDTEGRVIYAGSFSKVVSSGLRVGYAVGPRPVIAKMTVAKQGEDVHTNLWAQMVCHAFMTEYDYEAHLNRIRDIYRRKAQLMMSLIDTYLVPAGISYTPVEGGLFVLCRLAESVDVAAFCERAVRKYKVAVVPGSAFAVEGEALAAFRVNYSTPTDEVMRLGMQRLGALADDMLRS